MNQSMRRCAFMYRVFFFFGFVLLFGFQTAYAATGTVQTITLSPGWNVVSTPRLLESHTFSLPETLSNFAIYTLDPSRTSGWTTMADLGQTQFVPLYGYFVNNKSTTSQTLTFNYKASTTPNERLFNRSFATSGWYAIGVANPTYADRQSEVSVDENNPSQVFGSVLDAVDLVVDFTDADSVLTPGSVALTDPWRAATASDVDSLADIRDIKGYATYINKPGAHYIGFQNESDDGGTGSVPAYTPGVLSITKTGDSPSGNVIQNGSSITLGKFTFHAQGEKLKVENLKVALTSSDASWGSIRNGALFANGVQIGSTMSILTATGTQFNLGSSLIIDQNQSVTIEVRGDIYDADGINDSTSGDTIKVQLLAGTSNVYRMTTLDRISSESKSANIVTVAEATLALSKYGSYANQTIVFPQTAYKIGEYRLIIGAYEGVNLDTITLTLSGSATVSHLTNLYVVYGSKTTTVKTTGVVSQSFSVNEALTANGTMNIAVYADMSGNILNGSTTVTSLSLSGTGQSSGSPVGSSVIVGQTINAVRGALTVATDASAPVSTLLVGGTMPIVGAYKFTASNDAFTVVDLSMEASSTDAIVELVFKDGSTELGRQPFNGNYATMTGLSLVVPANTSKVITVYAQLGSVGTNAAASGQSIQLALTAVKYRDSNGVETNPAMFIQTNPMYVYKTKSTITNVALPTTILSAGTMTVAQFTITADAAGTIAWRQIKLNVATTSATAALFNIYDSANQSTSLANTTCTLVGSTVTCVSTQDQEISGSKTYVVKATIGGVIVGSSVSTNIPSSGLGYLAPAASNAVGIATASFIWSDESVVPHTGTSADWSNDYLVKNLPTDSQTLTK